MNLDHDYLRVKTSPEDLWKLLRPEIRQAIEKKAGIAYGQLRFRRAGIKCLMVIMLAGLASAALLTGSDGKLTPALLVLILLSCTALLFVSIVKGLSGRAEDVFQDRLGTTTGVVRSICESGIRTWQDAPHEIKEICSRCLRHYGEEVNESRLRAKVMGIEDIVRPGEEPSYMDLFFAHRSLFCRDLVDQENPDWYLSRSPT
ncbi:MAG TPA: hypothetical protein VFQ72_03395 [Candidatus Paceibacterota bacterium]|nr:hypothetical protein [Candidatus Paceibacterota bacterium]